MSNITKIIFLLKHFLLQLHKLLLFSVIVSKTVHSADLKMSGGIWMNLTKLSGHISPHNKSREANKKIYFAKQ